MRLVNAHGKQVVDTLPFNAEELHERTFVKAMRTKLCLEVGNAMSATIAAPC